MWTYLQVDETNKFNVTKKLHYVILGGMNDCEVDFIKALRLTRLEFEQLPKFNPNEDFITLKIGSPPTI